MERQLVLLQNFVQACCGSGAEASVHRLMARDLAQPQRLLGAVLALILAGSGGMNHRGSALDLERQDAHGLSPEPLPSPLPLPGPEPESEPEP